ncbi:methyltransferase domain-containing protein [Candidatus Lokiarchaeum ossiferum]|uniref:methyltransferase domain-containing protein n=1 Tax=Candidatus Lokiarchaeum ossiferum TaxID=2951803 RepID=UPI00352F2D6E
MSEYFQNSYWKRTAQQELPYLPTPMDAITFTFDFLDDLKILNPNIRLIDLGAGDGRIILYAAEKYRLHALGLEVNVELIESTNEKIIQKKIDSLCEMREGDFYDFNLSSYDIIFCFLLPTNHVYFKHVLKTIKSGAHIITSKWSLDTYKKEFKKSYILHPLKDYTMFVYEKD